MVKIERPGRGDETRAWAPPTWGPDGALFLSFNRNKRSLALDIKAPGARAVIERLVRRSDVLVQSFRPGGADALGFGVAAARALNPRLVYCSVTAFGTRGPLRDQPGYDPMMQAYSGFMRLTGHPGQAPVRAGTSLVDMGTGMWAALAIVAALRERDRTGEGAEVTTALFDTALAVDPVPAHGLSRDRRGPAAPGLRRRDDRALPGVPHVGRLPHDHDADRRALRAALRGARASPGSPPTPGSARTPTGCGIARRCVPALEALTRPWATAVLLERLRAAGVTAGPVQTVDQVVTDPQTKASEMLVATPRPDIPDLTTVAFPVRFGDGAPGPAPAAAARRRAHHRRPRGAGPGSGGDGGAPRAGRRRLAAARVIAVNQSARRHGSDR